MAEPSAKACPYTDVPGAAFGDSAPGVTIRWLIDEENDGAPVYALRMIEVAPDGHTPRHTHPYEHENFIVSGEGRVLIGSEWHSVSAGHVVFVPPGIEHTYENTGKETFIFLCGVPVSKHTASQ